MAGVYVIAHDLDDGWAAPCKIGVSASWPKRLKSLQSGNPKPIGLYAFVDIGDRACALNAEWFLHSRLSDKRLTGEWFDVEPAHAACLAQFFVAAMVHIGATESGIDADAVDIIDSMSSGPGARHGGSGGD